MLDNTYKDSAEYYGTLARRSVTSGNSHGASVAFWMSEKAWEKAVGIHPSLINYLVAARKEYGEFMHGDRRYGEILQSIKRSVARHKCILQSRLISESGGFAEDDVREVLRFAVSHAELRRVREGADYRITSIEADWSGVKSLLRTVKSIIPLKKF